MAKNKKKADFEIWSSYSFDPMSPDWDEAWEDEREAGYGEEERYSRISELHDGQLDGERANLNIRLPEEILAIASIGRWDGTFMGYRELNSRNLADVLRYESDSRDAEWTVDARMELRSRQSHVDGDYDIRYRMWRPGLSDAQKGNFFRKVRNGRATQKDITRYTARLGDYVDRAYGFRLGAA